MVQQLSSDQQHQHHLEIGYKRKTWSWTSSLQNCRKINSNSLTYQSVRFCCGSPSKVHMTLPQGPHELVSLPVK